MGVQKLCRQNLQKRNPLHDFSLGGGMGKGKCSIT